jgi:hypothetical protein
MILHMRGAAAGAQAAAVCAECGAQVSGNFCSACGADQRTGALGVLGDVTAPVRQSFPWVYLKILRAPVRETVALAEDRAYRSHVSFLLSGIAVFCLLMIPILLRTVVPAGAAPMSESLQTYLKIISQVGVYVGAAITFLLAYALFRYFSKQPRTLKAYFKLYCLAFGFVMPLYAAYEFLARSLLGGIGMSSLEQVTRPEQLLNPLTLLSTALALLLWAYFVAIHRRFWHMSLWRATALYVVAALSSSQIAFWLMFFVGALGREVLVAAGIVTV